MNDAMCRANRLADYINNDNVAAYNEAITQVAAEKKVVLLNTAEVYTGEDGQLPAELANDGCHFVYGEYGRWADYLRRHPSGARRLTALRAAKPSTPLRVLAACSRALRASCCHAPIGRAAGRCLAFGSVGAQRPFVSGKTRPNFVGPGLFPSLRSIRACAAIVALLTAEFSRTRLLRPASPPRPR